MNNQQNQKKLCTKQILGQDIHLEYNFQQCQRQCSDNSFLSKFSEELCLDPHDSKTYNCYDFHGKDSSKSSLSASLRRSNKGSARQIEQSIIDKSAQKLQSGFSRRKILMNHQKRFSQRYLQQVEKEKGIIHVIKKYWLAKRFINNMLKNTYVLSKNLKIKLDEDLYGFTQSRNQDSDYINKNTTYDFLLPTSTFVRIWDFILIITNLLNFWMLLYLFSFQIYDNFELTMAELIAFMFIIMDCIIDSRRAIIIQGEIVTSKQIIFQQYGKQSAFEDIIQCFGWVLLILQVQRYSYLSEIITIILAIISMRKLNKKYSNFIDSLYLIGVTNNALYDLFTLIISIISFAHTMACIWHYVGQKTIITEKSWLINYDLLNTGSLVKYNYSFYWATMTMVTVGYGDITPQNQWEMLVANILMLCSTCMFAYSMNSIGIIVKSFYDSQQKFKRSLIQINNYMTKHRVTQNIQEKIRNYIRFQLQKQLEENQEELSNILNNLPTDLLNELNTDIQSQIIQKIHVFKSFSQQAQHKLAQSLVSQQYTPGDIIYHKNEDKTNLYFIEQGNAEIFQEQTGKVIFTLSKGETFGFYPFFTGQQTEFSIRSVGFAQIYCLNRKDALTIFQLTSKDWEFFHNVKDQIIFNNDYSALNQICKFCKNYGHLTNKCPKITYQPNFESVYKKNNMNDECQEREFEYQRFGEKMSSLKFKSLIIETIHQFQKFNHEIINSEDRGRSDSFDIIKIDPTIEQKKNDFLSSNLNSSILKRTGSRVQRSSICFNIPPSNLNNNFPKDVSQGVIQLQSEGALSPYKNTSLSVCFNEDSFINIDKIKIYSDYMTQNNITSIISNYNNYIPKIIPKDTFLELYKYTFNYQVISLVAGIRKKLENRQNLLSFRNSG